MKETRGRLFATCTLLLTVYAGAQSPTRPIAVTGADTAAAAEAKTSVKQIFTANTPVGLAAGKGKIALQGPPTVPFPEVRKRWPGELSYLGGQTVGEAEFHAIYILNSPTPGGSGCTPATIAACWGNPERFLKNLGLSDFIRITDQYVQRNERNRYTLGGNAEVYFTSLPHTLTDADMLAVVHLVASALNYQTGYHGIFHVFIPPGTDECFDSTYTQCYSPDNPSSFAFCGYHSSADFTDIGHVLYSVEPSQDVNGCSVPPGGPQGQLADSTNNVLSHESFETITDPDGTAWLNVSDNALYGSEIADECSFIVFPTPTSVFFNPSIVWLNGVKYAAQPEYNNDGHACMVAPE